MPLSSISDNILGAVIGFEKRLYFVEEPEGEIVVSVAVLSGSLSEEVVVPFSTSPDTASGLNKYSVFHSMVSQCHAVSQSILYIEEVQSVSHFSREASRFVAF